jgi:hypothetical protein
MAKYFDTDALKEMGIVLKKIYAEREAIYRKYKVDLLDTDALSSLTIYDIVSQYDKDYNINFSRNGEDASSKGVLIEQKATRVDGALTKTGKPRKNAGSDASFLFHAMGDIDHPRYIFVARNKDDLAVVRLYDISSKANCKIVSKYLLGERDKWLAKGKKDKAQMKRDIISITEKYIKENLKLPTTLNILGCVVYKD